MADWLAMGGYGFYVWTSFGACALAIALEGLALRARRRRAFADLAAGAEDAR